MDIVRVCEEDTDVSDTIYICVFFVRLAVIAVIYS